MDDKEKPKQDRKGGDFYHEEGRGIKVMDICGADLDLSIGARRAPDSGTSPCSRYLFHFKQHEHDGF
jgi:hypothetical protein